MRQSLTLLNATLAYRLTVTNRTGAPIQNLLIVADMISAHASMSREEQLSGPISAAVTKQRIDRLDPGESRVVQGEFRLPFPQIVPIRTEILVPMLESQDIAEAKRTVDIVMTEKDDGSMVFEPAVLKVKAGETIRLAFVNMGETDHEFVMDTNEAVLEHKAQMEKFPEMEHADANSLTLAPGASGEIVWTFANAGDFTFACLIPGHYESGMKGDITVSQ